MAKYNNSSILQKLKVEGKRKESEVNVLGERGSELFAVFRDSLSPLCKPFGSTRQGVALPDDDTELLFAVCGELNY